MANCTAQTYNEEYGRILQQCSQVYANQEWKFTEVMANAFADIDKHREFIFYFTTACLPMISLQEQKLFTKMYGESYMKTRYMLHTLTVFNAMIDHFSILYDSEDENAHKLGEIVCLFSGLSFFPCEFRTLLFYYAIFCNIIARVTKLGANDLGRD